MWEIFIKIIFFIIVLPVLVLNEGWVRFKAFMSRGNNRWSYLPYALLAFLVLLLLILLQNGYRY